MRWTPFSRHPRLDRLPRLLSGGLVLLAAGCARPLLSPTDERTPFDRFDALRAQAAPQYIEDEFGRQQPNLRERLAPRE